MPWLSLADGAPFTASQGRDVRRELGTQHPLITPLLCLFANRAEAEVTPLPPSLSFHI